MSELTDRMRTCAAFIVATHENDDLPEKKFDLLMLSAMLDASDLLIEASNLLEAAPTSLGEPMEIIEPPPSNFGIDRTPKPGMWIGDDLKPIPDAPPSRNACPKCDSRASKTVRKAGKHLAMECPVCGHMWRR